MNPVVMSLTLGLWIALGALVALVILMTFRYIPNDRVGIVEKLWSPSGSVTSGFIALNGEAGFQPELLRGGWHVLLPVPVPAAQDASRHHSTGKDRLRLRA